MYDLFGFICKFPDVLIAYPWASTIGNVWSICFDVNILICLALSNESEAYIGGCPLLFSFLLNSGVFSTISTILFVFSFSGMFF